MRRVGLSLVLVPMLVVALAACDAGDGRVPEIIQGRWATDDPAYTDRYLEINAERLMFETVEAGLRVHSILGVESDVTERGEPLHILHYEEGSDPWELRLVVHGTNPTTLRIDNRSQLWRTAPEPKIGVDLR